METVNNNQEGGLQSIEIQQPHNMQQLQTMQQPHTLWRPWLEELESNLHPDNDQLPEAEVMGEMASLPF